MPMDVRYEKFNEMMFEIYCKTAIDNAIAHEKKRKALRNKLQPTFSSLPEHMIYSIGRLDPELEQVEEDANAISFEVKGARFLVRDPKLGQALSFLIPKDRGIILLHYFAGMSDEEVAGKLHIGRSTINRRRRIAEERLRGFLEGDI